VFPSPTTSAPTTSGGLVVRTRVGDGLLVGAAAAGIGGGAWWAIAAFGQFEQWHYASAVLGLLVGFGVILGARRGGPVPAIIAFVLASVAMVVCVYLIDRSLQIAALEDAGITSAIPLWSGFSAAREVISGWVDVAPEKAAGWLLAPLIAAIVAGRPSSRPALD